MKEAYSLLYIIENSLRIFVESELRNEYGNNWYTTAPRINKFQPNKKPFSKLFLYELIPYLSIYPCLEKKVSKQTVSYLNQIIPIRNKIAHSVYLEQSEMTMLKYNYDKIIISLNK